MKKIWITGGGSGIGKSLAQKLAAKGHQVIVSGRDPNKLNDVAPTVTAMACDISDPEDVAKTIQAIGPIDIAILNAGSYAPGSTVDCTMDSFRNIMEVNYFGTLHCLQNLIPPMREKGGHIAVVASLAAYRGLPNASGYGPSKAALLSLCESMRAELQGSALKFQVVNPGFVKSPLTSKNEFDMPYLMEPDDAADEILKGLNSERFEIAFPAPFVKRMKFLRVLPYKYYFSLIKKVTGA